LAIHALAAKHVADLAFQRLLDDQAKRKANKIAPARRCPQLSVHQGSKCLARACWASKAPPAEAYSSLWVEVPLRFARRDQTP
jgi:hypothetical protein